VPNATTDLDAGIAEVHTRLELDGNRSVAPRPKKRTVRRPFVGYDVPTTSRSRRHARTIVTATLRNLAVTNRLTYLRKIARHSIPTQYGEL
jgi:hypothetical protein